MVWVVLGENGEYSDRSVFVSGVFATEPEAQNAVVIRSAVARAWSEWKDRFDSKRAEIFKDDPYRFDLKHIAAGKTWDQVEEQEADIMRVLSEIIGPEPEYERGESFWIVEAEIGKWYGGR